MAKQSIVQYLFDNISSRIPLRQIDQDLIADAFIHERLAKHSLVLRQDKIARKLYLVESGIFRSFYSHDGRDVSSWFYKEGQWMTSWHSFYNQRAGFESIEALEECSVYSLDKHRYDELIKSSRAFESFMRLLAEEQLAFMDLYFKGYMFMSAREKYDLLLSHFPDIELRVKLGTIASYLGISQETLSRLRK